MKLKRPMLFLILIIFLSFLLTACGDNDDQYVIKFPHVVEEDSPKGKAANLFKELVDEKLGDQVEVEIYPNSQLYDEEEALEALEVDNVQMIAPSNSKMIGLDDSFEIFLMPYLFNNAESVIEFAQSDKGQELYSGLDKYNMEVLSTWTGGDMQISNDKQEITKPEDMEGLKIRVMAGGILSDFYSLMDAGTSVIPFDETYVALQQGIVDGQENPYNNIETQKIHEVQSYITETAHSFATYPLVVNKDFWEGLPDDIRSELEEILDEVTEKELEWTNELNEESKQKIVDAGETKITELTDDEKQELINAVEPLYDKYGETIGEEYIDYAKSLD